MYLEIKKIIPARMQTEIHVTSVQLLTTENLERINNKYKNNTIYVYKHEMDETIDLSELQPETHYAKDKFGSDIKKTYYDLNKLQKSISLSSIDKVTRKIGSELKDHSVVSSYKYYVVVSRVEIYAKEKNKLQHLSCKISINHEKKQIFNNLILA